MKYGDFSSLIQLGVGLHVGSALLQIYGEIGMQPLVRVLERVNKLVSSENINDKELIESLVMLETEFDIFKIKLFNEYKYLMMVNSTVAASLLLILILISFRFDSDADLWVSFIFVVLSFVPAIATLWLLWLKASKRIQPLQEWACNIEEKALKVKRL